ncbi:hypothetical protein HY605_01510, partial [Candidatus Peregrinibacteria bacterium]|nr:hypothetical protein [Candidatus Peregrinibacteria bacterium]
MQDFKRLLEIQVGDNSVRSLFYAFGLFVVLFILLKLFKRVVLVRLKKLTLKTRNGFDDFLSSLVESIPNVFYLLFAFYFSLKQLKFDANVSVWLRGVFIVAFVYVLIK